MKDFPIQGDWWPRGSTWEHILDPPTSVPWELIAPHAEQAAVNHGGQTLEQLAARGGLSSCEAVAVLEDRAWHRMDVKAAKERLADLILEFNTKKQNANNQKSS